MRAALESSLMRAIVASVLSATGSGSGGLAGYGGGFMSLMVNLLLHLWAQGYCCANLSVKQKRRQAWRLHLLRTW